MTNNFWWLFVCILLSNLLKVVELCYVDFYLRFKDMK